MGKEKNRGSDDKSKKKQAKAGKAEKKGEVAAAAAAPQKTPKGNAGSFVVLPCTCAHHYQDLFWGKGQRVFNVGKEGRVCTVCGAKK